MFNNNQFNYNNIKLHYVKGPDNGPPVVLLHGLSNRWQTYLPLIPFLYPYYSIYALDLSGHGKSYRTENYKIIDYVHDVESFLMDLFDKPVSLIGHSLGASISLVIAAKHPEKCRSISLIEPLIFKDKLDDKVFCDYFNGCLNICKQHEDISTIYKNIKETGTLAKKRAVDLFQLDKKTLMTVLDKTVFDGFNLSDLLSKISCPVLVLRGNPELEGYITEEKADYLKEKINDCVIEYLEKSSHVVHIDQPVETAQYLLNFLASI